MNLNKTKGRLLFAWIAGTLGILTVLLSGCRPPKTTEAAPTPAAATATRPAAATPTVSPLPPTPTSEPSAAIVNGESIPLTVYRAEYTRYQAARQLLDGQPAPEEEAASQVISELITQVLLAQAARQQGYAPDEAGVEAHLEEMRSAQGDAWTDWLEANAYTEETLRNDLRRQMAAAWMRDRIVAAVPETMLQVHARQILLYNPDEAQEVYAGLQRGTDFATLAAQYDPVSRGDLGWFPRGYLFVPAVEEAAFALQPGEYSNIIESDLGYHIVQVIERQEERLLSTDARLVLQGRVLQSWITTQQAQSQIEILVPAAAP